VHVRVIDSIDVNCAKYPTDVRPLLVYYWMGPGNSKSWTRNFHGINIHKCTPSAQNSTCAIV